MKDIKSIECIINNHALIINIGEKIQIEYENRLGIISKEKIFEYLINLFCIIDSWDEEYIDTKMIDNSKWELTIIHSNGIKINYHGKSNYPNNFEAFERLNQRLIEEVYNG